MKRNTLVAGALLGSVFVLSGCEFALDFRERQQDVVSYDVAGDVKALNVDSGSGDIVVTESDRSGVHVTETVHWRGDRPATEHPVNGGTLTLRYRCDGHSCSVDYKVEVPRGVSADLDAGSGTITLRGLTGQVKAVAGSGDIEAAGLGSKRFAAEAGSGDVEARFTVAPDSVEIEAGSGDVAAHVPAGGYNVTSETGSGETTVEVTRDPSSSRRITVRTGSGDAGVLLP
ncbi:DUF4097 family beta strand repeat-containing protein [Streptosporangium sp. NPDC023615]|uniref:DUF4097 family beta strand repeat-containing protein n=1 Tax=Streptosporangium sp. NPDC023615 TaxID=3154794 RepID=UPI00341F8666